MATVDGQTDPEDEGVRFRRTSHRGQDTLAEVVLIRRAHDRGRAVPRPSVTVMRVTASHSQATSTRSTPRPSSSPAPRRSASPWVPNDAA